MGKRMKTKVGFIVLNYNDFNTTINLVDSLIKWDFPNEFFRIVIVDNRSNDDSYKKLCEHYKLDLNVDVIQSEKNGGYSYGNNFGVKYAVKMYMPEYIVISNPDIQISKSTFLGLLDTFKIDESIAMVSPVMKDINGNYKIYSQKLPSYIDDLKACYNSSKSATIIEDDLEYFDSNRTMIITQMLPGSLFVVRTDYFQEVGMFDENVFLFCEERIIGKKMNDKGYKLILRKDLFFVHAHSVSIKKAYDVINTWKILLNSRWYYQRRYNKINFLQSIWFRINIHFFVVLLNTKMHLYKILKEK